MSTNPFENSNFFIDRERSQVVQKKKSSAQNSTAFAWQPAFEMAQAVEERERRIEFREREGHLYLQGKKVTLSPCWERGLVSRLELYGNLHTVPPVANQRVTRGQWKGQVGPCTKVCLEPK